MYFNPITNEDEIEDISSPPLDCLIIKPESEAQRVKWEGIIRTLRFTVKSFRVTAEIAVEPTGGSPTSDPSKYEWTPSGLYTPGFDKETTVTEGFSLWGVEPGPPVAYAPCSREEFAARADTYRRDDFQMVLFDAIIPGLGYAVPPATQGWDRSRRYGSDIILRSNIVLGWPGNALKSAIGGIYTNTFVTGYSAAQTGAVYVDTELELRVFGESIMLPGYLVDPFDDGSQYPTSIVMEASEYWGHNGLWNTTTGTKA